MKKNAQFRWGWKPTKKLNAVFSLIEKGTVLDIGCGSGGNSILLAKKGFQVIALDRQKEAIDCLKKRLKNRKFGSLIDAKEIDLSTALWPERKYSLILALNVLHFLSPQRAQFLIRKMKTSLKHQGIIFIRVFSHKNQPKSKGYHPPLKEIEKMFKDFQILELQHYRVEENHPPAGSHAHWILDLLVRKANKMNAALQAVR